MLNFFLALLCIALAPAEPVSFQLSPANAEVTFAVGELLQARHLVEGRFHRFSGSGAYAPGQPDKCGIVWSVDAASLDTGHAERDRHLRSADYLDVQKHPAITFSSRAVDFVSAQKMIVTGELTLHGVTRRIKVPVQIDTDGGFDCEFTLLRSDYGLSRDFYVAADAATLHVKVQP